MQVRCPLCWAMYNDQLPHSCSRRGDNLDAPVWGPPAETCSPAEPPASSEKNRLTLTLYTSDAIKLRDCLRHVGKLAILTGMPQSVFFDTLRGVETSLTNALVQSGTPQSTENLLKKKTEILPQRDVITLEVLTRAVAWAARTLIVSPHPYSLAVLLSEMSQKFPSLNPPQLEMAMGAALQRYWKAKGVSQSTDTPSDTTG